MKTLEQFEKEMRFARTNYINAHTENSPEINKWSNMYSITLEKYILERDREMFIGSFVR